MACIVPPKPWAPPFALAHGTNGASAESFRFLIRRQLTSHLCKREANTAAGGAASFKYGRKPKAGGAGDGEVGVEGEGGGGAKAEEGGGGVKAVGPGLVPECGPGASPAPPSAGPPAADDADSSDTDDDVPPDGLVDGEFAFVVVDRTHTLKSFAAVADWVKAHHFSDPTPEPAPGARKGRRGPPGPTVEQVEAEFWRIVESPDATIESLYGQDLDSGHHGSGFPLPPLRRALLAEHLKAAPRPPGGKQAKGAPPPGELRPLTPDEEKYAAHPWNINNMPRSAGSLLRHVLGDELITGVMVPWLYVGSALSAFAWHIEDHGLCSVNYLHMGAPKASQEQEGVGSGLGCAEVRTNGARGGSAARDDPHPAPAHPPIHPTHASLPFLPLRYGTRCRRRRRLRLRRP